MNIDVVSAIEAMAGVGSQLTSFRKDEVQAIDQNEPKAAQDQREENCCSDGKV